MSEPTKPVQVATLDLIAAMRERWLQEFENGWLPDSLAAKAFELDQEFWKELSRARSEVDR